VKTTRQPDREIVRSVVSEGCTWTVDERPVPYGHSQHALVFMSDRIARRVKHYPANWFELPDEALAALSSRA